MRLFALAFVLGALVLQNQRSLPESRIALAAVAAGLACALVPRERAAARALFVLACGALAGFAYAGWRAELRLAESLPLAWEGRDVAVTGIVAALPQPSEAGTRFLFEADRWGDGPVPEGFPSTLALAWFAEADAPAPRLCACERWRLVVRLKRPRGLANPHAFDFEAWALERGIRATGYVRAQESPRRLAERVDGWPCTLHRWRGAVREAMLRELGDARLRGVLVALAIGDQDAIAEPDWETFWRTGVGHLMSISGLHITMLAAFGFAITAFAWVRVPRLAL